MSQTDSPAPKIQFNNLNKLTASYSQTEDRIKLVAACGDQALVYWLTRRMLSIILPAVFDWLGKHHQPGEKIEGASSLPTQRTTETRMAMAQASAQAQLAPQAPVVAERDAPSRVLTSIDVKVEDKRLLLILPIDDTQRGVMAFQTTSLSQWLGIIYQVCRDADWALTQWPHWFIEVQTPPANTSKPQLH